jgi:hypothetical protein
MLEVKLNRTVFSLNPVKGALDSTGHEGRPDEMKGFSVSVGSNNLLFAEAVAVTLQKRGIVENSFTDSSNLLFPLPCNAKRITVPEE